MELKHQKTSQWFFCWAGCLQQVPLHLRLSRLCGFGTSKNTPSISQLQISFLCHVSKVKGFFLQIVVKMGHGNNSASPKLLGCRRKGVHGGQCGIHRAGTGYQKRCKKEKQVSIALALTQSYMKCICKNTDRICLFSPLSNMSNCFLAGVLASKLSVCSGSRNISCDFSHPGIPPRFQSCSSQLNATS